MKSVRTWKRGRWDPKRLVRSNPGFRLQKQKLIKNYPHVLELQLIPVGWLLKNSAGSPCGPNSLSRPPHPKPETARSEPGADEPGSRNPPHLQFKSQRPDG